MTASIPSASTVGVIANRVDKPVHRIAYVIRSRGIAPMAKAGNARVFSEEAVQRIAAELRQIDEARRGSEGAA